MDTITIFTDGSSRGNPGPGGFGAIVAGSTEAREIGGRDDRTTNNRMELRGVIEALRIVPETISNIVIHTDSSYVLKGGTTWVKGWERNGWKTSTGEQVLNEDIWKEFIDAYATVSKHSKIRWVLIKGHAGVPGNERCDEIATAFADGKDIVLYKGSREAYSIDLETVTPDANAPISKKSRSKEKAYSYLSLVNGVLEKHATWKECEARVKGKKSAKYKKALSATEEKSIITSWGL